MNEICFEVRFELLNIFVIRFKHNVINTNNYLRNVKFFCNISHTVSKNMTLKTNAA